MITLKLKLQILKKVEVGEHLYDQEENTVKVVYEEYHNVCA